jgi:hypothetical protein
MHGPDPATYPVPSLQYGDIKPPCDESLGSRKSGDASANDDDVVLLQAYT